MNLVDEYISLFEQRQTLLERMEKIRCELELGRNSGTLKDVRVSHNSYSRLSIQRLREYVSDSVIERCMIKGQRLNCKVVSKPKPKVKNDKPTN